MAGSLNGKRDRASQSAGGVASLLPKIISLARNFRCATNHFDCAARALLHNWRTARELQMLTIIVGFLIVVSIGVLVAHAIDAFRSDSHPTNSASPGQNAPADFPESLARDRALLWQGDMHSDCWLIGTGERLLNFGISRRLL